PPIMKNERLNAYRDFLKREQPKPEHKAPKRYVEVASNDSTGIQLPKLLQDRGSRYAPPQRITPG
ncbi:MAG: hypothetical protein SOZ09_10725, partial [Eubacteriales bacterium]|nr:hypothetical protein [Eubacteriales bacterium]